MSRIEYDLLVADRPDLKLPNWLQLDPQWRHDTLTKMTVEELTAARAAVLLTTDFQPRDHYYRSVDW